MKQYSFITIGCGSRGTTYTTEMLKASDRYKLVGMADPMSAKREKYMREFGLTAEQCYADWREILAKPKMADLAIIATIDNMHYEPAMRAIELGYDLLLEKPVANTEKECIEIANAAKRKGVRVLVCHVLRYTPFYKTVKSIVKSGLLGRVMSVDQVEGIGDMHFTHSYVRGNWHNTKTAAPMLLAKSCHDIDVIQWLINKPCQKVSSFGDLTYFTAQNAPEGAPEYCIDGTCPIQDSCIYNCRRMYTGEEFPVWKKLFCDINANNKAARTDEEICTLLRQTEFGKCVFHANNNVLDHQVVNMQFEGGVTATLNVNAFARGGRYTRVYGTKGELFAFFSDKEISVRTFADRRKFTIPVQESDETIAGGHGGGDAGIAQDLYRFLEGEEIELGASEIGISVYNHLIGYAAEHARHTNAVVDVNEFCQQHGFENSR